jgi:hypothetical protein
MVLPAASLLFCHSVMCFGPCSYLLAHCLVGKVKIRLKQHNGPEFGNVEAIGLLE